MSHGQPFDTSSGEYDRLIGRMEGGGSDSATGRPVDVQAHLDESRRVRRATRSRVAVAKALGKYQDATTWPRTGLPLPEPLLETVSLQRASRTVLVRTARLLALAPLLCWLWGVLSTLAIIGISSLLSECDDDAVDAYGPASAPSSIPDTVPTISYGIALFVFCNLFLTFLAFISIPMFRVCCARWIYETHVRALHMLYLYEHMELRASRDVVFNLNCKSNRWRGMVRYTLYSNGDTEDFEDDSYNWTSFGDHFCIS